jgi:hypothetical protein
VSARGDFRRSKIRVGERPGSPYSDAPPVDHRDYEGDMQDESPAAPLAAAPAIWTLELSLETDDEELIERLQEQLRA